MASCIIILVAILAVSREALAQDSIPLFGINYGQVADNLPPPSRVVPMLKSMRVGMARIFDYNPSILSAFANSGIPLWISVPNSEIRQVAFIPNYAERWVRSNVLRYRNTKIQTVLVGNEVLASWNIGSYGNYLVQAMRRIKVALNGVGLQQVMVATPLSGDILEASYPPSSGSFRSDLSSIMGPLLEFLNETNSVFCANLYPYYAFASNPEQINLEYALLNSSEPVVYDGNYSYTALLDAMTDAVYAALDKAGYGNMKLVITETGWPSAGATYATKQYAATFNGRLLEKLENNEGTPRKPDVAVPTFIFALFNEDRKSGALIEKNWGLLYPSGRSVYQLSSIGRQHVCY